MSTSKDRIYDGFMHMCVKKPINEITIQEIADECGISRRTVYNHFHDKYEIMNSLHTRRFVEACKASGPKHDMRSAIVHLCRAWYENQDYYRSVFSHTGQNSYPDMLFHDSFCAAEAKLKECMKTDVLNEDITFQLEFYLNAAINASRNWLNSRTPVSPEVFGGRLFGCLPVCLARCLAE